MSKNLCPTNDLTFENSHQIKFGEILAAGTYTISGIIKSTDSDSSVCLMLFYYVDGTSKEVYINRSVNDERVSKTTTFDKEVLRVRVYASEGYSLSVGDTGTFNKLQVEKGSEMTEYVPYGTAEEYYEAEVALYWAAIAGKVPISVLPEPSCRVSILLRKYLDPEYSFPYGFSTAVMSRVEYYIWDLILGTSSALINTPKSDAEKYLHAMIGGTVEDMPDPEKSELNSWMNEALNAIRK